MIDSLTREQYDSVLRQDFVTFAARCFHDLNPRPSSPGASTASSVSKTGG